MTVTLEKRTEQATASLVNLLKTQQQKGIDLGDLTAQVEIAIDYSGSMSARYPDEVQEAVERALALSLSGLDDDGIVPLHFFTDRDFPVEYVSEDGRAGTSSYQGFVAQWAKRHQMGSTNYSPTIENILKGAKKTLFGRGVDLAAERDGDPKLVLFVTDGDPSRSDRPKIERLLASASSRPIFWQFIGLGPRSQLDYIQQLNKGIEGAVIDNVGVTIFEETRGLTDGAFFDDVIREFFTAWLPEARRLGITRK